MTCLCCLQYRWNVFKGIRQAIEDNEGGLDKFSQGVSSLPFHRSLHAILDICSQGQGCRSCEEHL